MKDTVSRCPIEEAMQLLSGRWPGLLIYYLKERPKRFGDLRRDNPTVSSRILTLELRKLEAAGVIERVEVAIFPKHVTYELTAAGRELATLLDAIGAWWEGQARSMGAPLATAGR
ncbi:helix-turn-helix domain-containing protein [Caulobacter sp. UNC358MFTsu5.1]|uniref:winged helix-turn-helix transcriptional regulator n=1 Tax=Caulobacter sp. UNC358MFTsu5.1 TaxID=1449049 RepID=UPI0004A76B80|nr:helix-turn-helix domain-containing protein [Caulobacter sp. UNC358MFTsu5.1]